MEDNTKNSDAIINSAINDPDVMDKLDTAKSAIQQLLDKKKELETSAGGAQTPQQGVKEDENPSQWNFEDTIDHLLQNMTGGYTYYNEPWNQRNIPKAGERYNINDETGKTIKQNASEDDVIEYANTVYHYDMADNDAEEFTTFEQAKNALEHDGAYKLVNVNDTKQMSLFPDKKKEVEPTENKIISKMDGMEYNQFISRFGGEGGFLNRVVNLLKNGEQQEAYNELRKQKDNLRENDLNNLMEYFANSDIFRIIAESERPKLTKQEILEFVLNKKNK
jgi:hypothetical protein